MILLIKEHYKTVQRNNLLLLLKSKVHVTVQVYMCILSYFSL